MFTTFITPQMSERPTAGSAYTPPSRMPLMVACIRRAGTSSTAIPHRRGRSRNRVDRLAGGHVPGPDHGDLSAQHLGEGVEIVRDAFSVELHPAGDRLHRVAAQPLGHAVLVDLAAALHRGV